MYTPTERAELIKHRLEEAFQPEVLIVTDESHLHVGHVGAKGGASHFAVVIKSQHFAHHSLIAQHRLIYQVLHDLIPHEIHALKIKSSGNSGY